MKNNEKMTQEEMRKNLSEKQMKEFKIFAIPLNEIKVPFSDLTAINGLEKLSQKEFEDVMERINKNSEYGMPIIEETESMLDIFRINNEPFPGLHSLLHTKGECPIYFNMKHTDLARENSDRSVNMVCNMYDETIDFNYIDEKEIEKANIVRFILTSFNAELENYIDNGICELFISNSLLDKLNLDTDNQSYLRDLLLPSVMEAVNNDDRVIMQNMGRTIKVTVMDNTTKKFTFTSEEPIVLDEREFNIFNTILNQLLSTIKERVSRIDNNIMGLDLIISDGLMEKLTGIYDTCSQALLDMIISNIDKSIIMNNKKEYKVSVRHKIKQGCAIVSINEEYEQTELVVITLEDIMNKINNK